VKYTYGFEKLTVWQDARILTQMVYELSKKLPAPEIYGLSSQMKRAAISVVSNIAEGSGRSTFKDQAHFYQIAFSSIIELLNQFIICNDLGFISDDELVFIRNEIEKVSNKINALRRTRINK
jgi:four helix bundle protein